MKKVSSGKIRDVYASDSDKEGKGTVYIVASDRVSAFDEVIPGVEIDGKGEVLTKISKSWARLIDNSLSYGADTKTAYEDVFGSTTMDELVESGINAKCIQAQRWLKMIKVEAIVRGYITGSLWKAYQEGEREFCGVKIPDGLKECDKLPQPVFTPTTKAPHGQHDQNLTIAEMGKVIDDSGICEYCNSIKDGIELANLIEDWSRNIYLGASRYAENSGLIIADAKFEFGIYGGELYLGDEILTPDSARYWLQNDYEPGRPQRSLDKQLIRDYIRKEQAAGNTNITIPEDIASQARENYWSIYNTLFPEVKFV